MTKQMNETDSGGNRGLTWVLIAAMINPVVPFSFYAPLALARDTDIYTSSPLSGTMAEPAVLLILDTSDSMNLGEPWREYDLNHYDSHVEYLWNSPAYINTISTQDYTLGLSTAGTSGGTFISGGNANGMGGGSPPTDLADINTTRFDSGWFYGATTTDSYYMRLGALAYAGGIHDPDGAGSVPPDPGPRSVYRKYAWSNDAPASGFPNGWTASHNDIWWVPVAGYSGASDPTIENDPRLRSLSLNKFQGMAALNKIGNTNKNGNPVKRGGAYFGQYQSDWVSPWVDARIFNQCSSSLEALTPSTVYAPSSYDSNAGKLLGQHWLRWENFLGLSSNSYPGNDTMTGSYYDGFLNGDRDRNSASGNVSNASQTAFKVEHTDDSKYAGWSHLKPDMGGEPNLTLRMQELSLLPDTVELGVVNNFLTAQGQSSQGSIASAWISLLEKLPPGGYFSQAHHNQVVGANNISKTRTCASGGFGTHWNDARLNDRVPGQTCAPTSGTNSDNCNNQSGSCQCSSSDHGDCSHVSDPGPCGGSDNTFYTRDNYGCGWVGTRARVDSADYSGCHWDTSRQQLVVMAEGGGGTFYYGGSCTGSCSGFNCPAPVNGGANYCEDHNHLVTPSETIAGVSYSNVTAGNNATAGCDDLGDGTYYWQGGVCQGIHRTAPSGTAPGPNTPVNNDVTACTNSAVASQTLGGTSYSQVVTNGYVTDGCVDAADTSLTCSDLLSGACITCGNISSSGSVGGHSYDVYEHVSMGANLVHDCLEDTGAPYIRNTHDSSYRANFNTSWNAGDGSHNNDSYSSDASHAYQNDNVSKINLYSANYLNWKFGAKVCRAGNDPAAAISTSTATIVATDTCRPIGRKTRLQIAKDALTALIDSPSANGVRFALMVFNMTDAGFNNEGGHIAFAMARMGSDSSDADYANRALLKNKINAMTAASRTPLTETLYEAYKYFRGEAPVFGHLSTQTATGIAVSDGFDTHAWNGNEYKSPMLSNPSVGNASSCQKNFVLLVTDGGPEDDHSADAAVQALIYAGDQGAISPDTNVDVVNADTHSGQFEIFTNNQLPLPVYAYNISWIYNGATIYNYNFFYNINLTPITDPATGSPMTVGAQVTIPGAGAGGADLVTTVSQVISGTNYAYYFLADTVVNNKWGVTAYSGSGGMHPYGPLDSADHHYIWLDELSYYMAHSDMSPGGGSASDTIAGTQPVNTYTIGFAGGTSPVLQNAANQGNGQFFTADDSAQLYAALTGSLAAIRDWNPSMAAATVPISAYNRSQSGNEVYMAFFGPSLSQAWNGTVKKYLFSTDANTCGVDMANHQVPLCMIGQTYLPAAPRMNVQQQSIDPITGDVLAEMDPSAVNQWGSTASGQEDGGSSNKGGTGYVMKMLSGINPNTRKVYTYIGAVSTSTDLTASGNQLRDDNALITKTMLGDSGMATSRRNSALNFARGGDPASPHCGDISTSSSSLCTTWRAWPHQDVLHSQPALLLYQVIAGTPPSKIEYLFYLSNDGLLHAVDSTTGIEAWAYMPEEALPKIASVMDNAANKEHLILADGSPVTYAIDVNNDGKIVAADGDKAYLIFGLRRGGHSYYALDVSDPTQPKYLWRISNNCIGAGALCKTIPELGESWSKPAIARLRSISDPVIVFGGGYDPVPNDMLKASITQTAGVANVSVLVPHGYATGDSVHISGVTEAGYNGDQAITVTGPTTFSYAVATSTSSPAHGQVYAVNNKDAQMGRGVFLVNAVTGNLIQQFTKGESGTYPALASMNYSIPSDAITLNTDQDQGGFADRLYIGDLGGQVWRFDLDEVSHYGVHKFADLTGSSVAASPTWPRRKILFSPVVVSQYVNGQHYHGVFVGTGDRENPLRTDQTDKVFMLKDFAVGLSTTQAPLDFSTSVIQDITDTPLVTAISDSNVSGSNSDEINTFKTALQTAAGWMMRLDFGNVSGPPAQNGGEKLVNTPSIFYNTVRFGTYSPRGSVSACLPPGAGLLYAVNAADGTVAVDTNHNGTVGHGDSRVISDFAIRDFVSNGQAIILGDSVEHFISASGTGFGEDIGQAGVGRAAYWYQEPEQ